MTYTRDNIVGLIFIDTSKQPYVIISIENERVTMRPAEGNPSSSRGDFYNEMYRTLTYLNDGTWIVTGKQDVVNIGGQYTKDNIDGLTIKKRKGKGTSEYIIRNCQYGSNHYKSIIHIRSGYKNEERIDEIIQRLNNGTWVVSGQEQVNKVVVLDTYQIY